MNDERKPEQPAPVDKRREIPAQILGVGLMALMILGMLAWVALIIVGPHVAGR